MQEETDKLHKFIEKVLNVVNDEEIAKTQIGKATGEYKENKDRYTKQITRIKAEMTTLRARKSAIQKIKTNTTLKTRGNEIRENSRDFSGN